MTTELHIHDQNQNPNDLVTDRFQHHKGFFIIDADCIITRNQVVDIRGEFQLVDFRSGGEIQYRKVEFWHAVMKDGWLKIIAYDIGNKTILTRIHPMNKVYATCDWFLISEDFIEEEPLI